VLFPKPVAESSLGSAPRSAAQLRVLAAALDLFAEHGVSGTSLQMIADAIGVTKAAVYHQFKSKDEIVIAAAAMELAWLEEAVLAAEAEEGRVQAREVLLTRVIDLAVRRRRMVGTLQRDPVMIRFLTEHEPFRQLIERMYLLLIGEGRGPEVRVPAAMLSAAIGGGVIHPLVVDLDDETLRLQLLRVARRFLDLPD
jgi:AcrR family transcriptional regulator